MKQKRVLIIGSGSRVRDTLLPALTALKNKYEIAGILSRSVKTINSPAKLFKFKTVKDLAIFDLKVIDIIVLSVTLESVPEILKKLSQKSVGNITLFLDTPVIPLREIRSLRMLRLFKRVLVLEDYVSTSLFDQAEKIIKRGTIGDLRKIYLFHSGYKYHSIAILKRLTKQNFISSAQLNNVGGGVSELILNFRNGITASVLEPRDYDVGRSLIVGSKGWLSDYSLGGIQGIKMSNSEKYVAFKIEAVKKLFDSYSKNRSYCYCYEDGVYDNILSSVLNRYGLFFDFKSPFSKHSIVWELIRFISRL